ncbi:MAG: alpha-amylase family glycosyl hydrolase [Phycisphaerales bacterium]
MPIPAAMLALSVAVGASRQEPTEWWRSAVFYEIFVRSFADSTEGPLAGDGIGDLRGIIERLDYLNDGDPETDSDLGITGIWLMPICESPSYHGYDVTDYMNVDPEYGTQDDFRALVAACHERGVRVIVDDVMNHCSSEHPWFQESLDRNSSRHDWFVWRDEPRTWSHGPSHPVWHDRYRQQTGQYYYGYFWHGMPDLNLKNPAVTRAMLEQSRFWVTTMGADGLRLDAVHYLIENESQFEHTPETFEWLQSFGRYIHEVSPGAFIVGEAWGEPDVIARYVHHGLDSAFAFPLCFAIEKGINAGDASGIAQALESAWNGMHGAQSTIIGNHDMDRIINRLGADVDKARCAAVILLTMPGVPFIYYGDEIGMEGVKPDPDIRTPMQWTDDPKTAGFTSGRPWRAVNPSVSRVNVEQQSRSEESLLSTYRKLIAMRRSTPALAVGDLALLDTGDARVLAFVRSKGMERVLVIVNVSDEQIRGGWSLDAGRVHVGRDGELIEMMHGAAAQWPSRANDQSWMPLEVLDAYTGYAIRLH